MENIISNILERLNRPITSHLEGNFKFWVIDDLLPEELALEIARKFPEERILRQRDSIREYKRVGVDFDRYERIMEEITYAFHDDRIVKKVEEITGIKSMIPDTNLYAGGLSSMANNSFLNPHLDNSHNDEKTHYRVLNLLYYVSLDWKKEYGGNLLLFPNGMNSKSIEVKSKFNRLVLMETNDLSYHAVTKVKSDFPRRCVSNYYFSEISPNARNYSHVTSFYPFPDQSFISSTIFTLDRFLRQKGSYWYKKIVNYKTSHKR